MCSSRERGFTLIEIIIALSIGSLLILVTSASIRTGLTYMQGGEERFDKGLKERVALNFFIQQIITLRAQSSEAGMFFVGNEETLSFISPLSVNKYYTYGLVICAYSIIEGDDKTYSLVYNETRLLNNDYLTELTDDENEERDWQKFLGKDFVVFFQGCQKITLEYLGEEDPEDEDEGVWKKTWEGKEGVPKAIKITLLKSGGTREAIAPIMVTS